MEVFASVRDRLIVASRRPWTDLRTISNSNAARSTVLIPIIGYLILFNENVVQYLSLSKSLGGESSAGGISLRLIFIYFGLCAVALGATVYSFWCPPEVKQYGSANAYIGGDGPTIGDRAVEKIEEELRVSPYVYDLQENETKSRAPFSATFAVNEKSEMKLKNGMLRIYFDYKNWSHPRARSTSTVAYAVGFTLLLIPSAEVFVRVIGLFTRLLRQ